MPRLQEFFIVIVANERSDLVGRKKNIEKGVHEERDYCNQTEKVHISMCVRSSLFHTWESTRQLQFNSFQSEIVIIRSFICFVG